MLLEFAISAQTINFIRWAFAISIIYIALPALILPVSGDSILERFFSRYIRMVALTLVLVFILVAIKLYEVLSLLFIFLMLVVLLRLPTNFRMHAFREMRVTFFTTLYDFLEGIFHPYQLFRKYIIKKLSGIKTGILKFTIPTQSIQTILLLSVLSYSAYLRFYDTFQHAAPAMNDAYVTLAWMKYIDGKILFHDGIYPQGFFIYLSILNKFAAIDALYIMKYTGPLTGVLTTISIYLFVAKVSGRKLPGIISAFVFGVLGGILPSIWDRQGASLSQEFGIAFLLPAWYYAIAYLQTRKKHYLWTASAAFVVIGLVHSLILAFVWAGLVCLVSAYLLLDFRQSIRSARYLITAGIVTGVVAALQVPIGWLAGKSFHSTSLAFLTEGTQTAVQLPALTVIDKLAVVGFLLFFIISIWKRNADSNPTISLFLFFLGLSSFLLYRVIGQMTGSLLLLSRSGVLWSIVAPVGVGIGAEALLRIIPDKKNTLKISIASVIVVFLMAWGITYYKPSPAQPYKMQYDAEINQYLRIEEEYTPFDWTIVANEEGYDLALNKGWHINIKDFLTWYHPETKKLVKKVDGKEEPLIAKDLFIFYQKKLFMVDFDEMKPILAQRIQDYAALDQWIVRYKENHNDLEVYYEDDFIVIYHLHDLKG